MGRVGVGVGQRQLDGRPRLVLSRQAQVLAASWIDFHEGVASSSCSLQNAHSHAWPLHAPTATRGLAPHAASPRFTPHSNPPREPAHRSHAPSPCPGPVLTESDSTSTHTPSIRPRNCCPSSPPTHPPCPSPLAPQTPSPSPRETLPPIPISSPFYRLCLPNTPYTIPMCSRRPRSTRHRAPRI